MSENYLETSGEALLKIREYIKEKMQTPFYNLAFVVEVKSEAAYYLVRVSLPIPNRQSGTLEWIEKTFKMSRSPPFDIEVGD